MVTYRRTPQGGFTLIELVVVIVILGILAAFAIPRFVNISTQARESAVRGLAGSLRSASALAHGLALASGQTAATGTIKMEGQDITLAYGYPTADATGIAQTVANMDGFLPTPGTGEIVYTPTNAPADPTKCQVKYTEATSATAPAAITLTIVSPDGCS